MKRLYPARHSAAFVAAFCVSGAALGLEVVVAPHEGGQGIVRALEALRQARAAAAPGEQFVVRLQAGDYVLTEPLRVRPVDSGTPESPTVIQGAAGGLSRLVGATRLATPEIHGREWRFTPHEPVNTADAMSGGEFFVNGVRANLAQLQPLGAFSLVAGAVPNAQWTEASRTAFKVDASMWQQLSALPAEELKRAVITVMHSWTSAEHHLSLDASTQQVRVSPSGKWPFLHFGRSQRYKISNLVSALDEPTEWALDGKVLRFLPPQKAVYADARWPRLETLLLVQGGFDAGTRVRHVHFTDVSFAFTSVPTSDLGWIDSQAAVKVSAAVEIDRADDVRFINCKVSHTGGHGIWLRAGVSGSEIRACQFSDLGAGAVRVGPAELKSQEALTQSNVVAGNVIERTGQRFPGAVAIWLGHAAQNIVEGNLIHQTTYSGISVGWVWGYGPSVAVGNVVRDNILLNIGQAMLGDLGGIYTLGNARGTLIQRNLIWNVEGYPDYGSGAWGIYSDEGTADASIRHNVVVGTRSGGYHLHYGRANDVSANLFAGGRWAEMIWSDGRRSDAWSFTDNALVSARSAVVQAPSDRGFWLDPSNQVLAPKLEWKLDAQNLSELNLVGLSGAHAATWRAVLARAQTLAKGARVMATPNLTVKATSPLRQLDVAAVPLGLRPVPDTYLHLRPLNDLDAMSVVADDKKGRCLELRAGLPGRLTFDPHLHWAFDHSSGPRRVDFNIRLGPQTAVTHEWRARTGGSTRATGPSVKISTQGISAGGKSLHGPLPPGWYAVSVTHLGGTSASWSLEISSSQLNKKWGPFSSPALIDDWYWIGWYSDSALPGQVCLADLKVQ